MRLIKVSFLVVLVATLTCASDELQDDDSKSIKPPGKIRKCFNWLMPCLDSSPKRAKKYYTDEDKLAQLDTWQQKVNEKQAKPGWVKRNFLQQSKRQPYLAKFNEAIIKAREAIKSNSIHKKYFWDECYDLAEKIDKWWYNRRNLAIGAIVSTGIGAYLAHNFVMGLFRQTTAIPYNPVFVDPYGKLPESNQTVTPTAKNETAWLIAFIVAIAFLTLVLLAVGLYFIKVVLKYRSTAKSEVNRNKQNHVDKKPKEKDPKISEATSTDKTSSDNRTPR